MKTRLPSHVFDLPVQELRRGYRSDIYFWREKMTLEQHGLHPRVTLQVFQKQSAVLCGMDEALAVLKVAAGRYRDAPAAYRLFDRYLELKQRARELYFTDRPAYLETVRAKVAISGELDALWESGYAALEVDALHDGDRIAPWETVLLITGDAGLFAHLETVYLGILARRTRVATNVRSVVAAARGKPVLFFPARHDHWAVQGGDGYAAHIGGAQGVSTEAQGAWWGARAGGTVPHALIAALGGDTVAAVRLFGATYPDVQLVALTDFDNDNVGAALACARALGGRLWGVRLDTAETMVDKALWPLMGETRPTGVVPELVFRVRAALDAEGFRHVKLIVSGGFDPAKIAWFEERGAPVDAYGVGSALLRGACDFTADVVRRDGRPCAKAGRWYRPNDRLSRAA